jgi:putative heme-binding domain-containing protein
VTEVLIAGIPKMTPRAVSLVTNALLANDATTRQLLDARKLTAGSYSSLQRFRLLNHGDPVIRKMAAELFSAPVAGSKDRKYAKHFAALAGKADPKRGGELFAAHCAICHSFGGSGQAVGPALDGEAGRPAESLLGDILNPSQNLTAGYATFLVKTKDGGSHAGVLTGESATSLTLTAAGGVKSVVLRRDLASIEKLDFSLMPLTFVDVLKPQDGADLIAYVKSRPAPESVVLFDEDPGFPELLAAGRGSAKLDWRDGVSGNASLTVSGFQRHSRQLPGWNFAIREDPEGGEFRYLRVAMKTRKSKGIMLELAADQGFPPENKAIRTYYAGENLTGWKSNRLAEKVPTEWQSFTIDLWKGNGEFNLTGIAFTVMNGEASYDRLELFRERP